MIRKKAPKASAVGKCPGCDELSEKELFKRIDDIIAKFKGSEGALIPVLQSVQNLIGHLPKNALQHISNKLDIPYSQVSGVVSFYSFFTTTPRGRNVVRVCLGTACYVRGGKEVLSSLEKLCNIKVGETTEDREFSLEVGRCFGACGLAPVVMVNDDVHQRVKPAKLKEILNQYRGKSSDAKESK